MIRFFRDFIQHKEPYFYEPLPDLLPPKEECCCFTGHRTILKKHLPFLCDRLEDIIEQMIVEYGVTTFLAGGAVGFDMLAEESVIKAKGRHPEIHLHLGLPCKDQAEGFTDQQKQKYQQLLESADSIRYVRPYFQRGCMHDRNRYLVDHSKFCISYQTRNSGGTAYTTTYAQHNDRIVINLADEFTTKTRSVFK